MESNDWCLKKLKQEIEKLAKLQAKLKFAIAQYNKNECAIDPCTAYVWIKSNLDIIKQISPELIPLQKDFEALYKGRLLTIESDLRDTIISLGFNFSGQWPKYYINYILPVIVDENKYTIYVNSEKFQTVDISKIVESIKRQIKNLQIEKCDLQGFLGELHDTYVKLSSPQNPTVAIWKIYREIVINKQSRQLWRDASSDNFRPFRELEFRASLTELLKKNITSISTHQLRLLPPISKDESMYIYQPAENRFCHVGRIEFIPKGETSDGEN